MLKKWLWVNALVSAVSAALTLAALVVGRGGASSDLLAYTSDPHGNKDIMLMDVARRRIVALTHAPADEYSPAWSRDGQRLAFVSDARGRGRICVLHIESGAVGCNIVDPATFFSDFQSVEPMRSPDGRHVVITRYLPRRHQPGIEPELYLIDRRTGATDRLTFNNVSDLSPAWRPR